ncbi:RICIN domain-containing protein [Microbispora rosea]|uniref:RICIN domain-containing protein n=1 Tax=Microbispora rosea TaxID=58117 RepID=UPI0004C3B9CE|nr:RICIN domain-containing protein [Microbispora rosea]
MFRISLSIRKAVITVATGALAAGMLALGAGAAHADSGLEYQIFPVSNPFLYLNVSGGSKGDGAKIIQYVVSGDNDLWYFRAVNGHTEIVNKLSNKCMTTDGVEGHQLYQWYCEGTPGQLWDIGFTSGIGGPSLVPGTIKNPASNLVADIAGGSITSGAAVIGYHYTGGTNQLFNALNNS